MSDWFKDTPRGRSVLAEERLFVAIGELVNEALEKSGMTRQELGAKLRIDQSEMYQRLSGQRNFTIRTLARMIHATGCELVVSLRDERQDTPPSPDEGVAVSSEEIEQRLQTGRQRQTGLDYERIQRIQLARTEYLDHSQGPPAPIGED